MPYSKYENVFSFSFLLLEYFIGEQKSHIANNNSKLCERLSEWDVTK